MLGIWRDANPATITLPSCATLLERHVTWRRLRNSGGYFWLPFQGFRENFAADGVEDDGRAFAVRNFHHSLVQILGLILE